MPKKNKKLLPAPLEPFVSKKTNLELSGNCLAALQRLKTNHGMSKTFAIERGVILLAVGIGLGIVGYRMYNSKKGSR